MIERPTGLSPLRDGLVTHASTSLSMTIQRNIYHIIFYFGTEVYEPRLR